jgi:hypothetical protein
MDSLDLLFLKTPFGYDSAASQGGLILPFESRSRIRSSVFKLWPVIDDMPRYQRRVHSSCSFNLVPFVCPLWTRNKETFLLLWYVGPDHVGMVYVAKQAEVTADVSSKRDFCSGQKALRPNFYGTAFPRVFSHSALESLPPCLYRLEDSQVSIVSPCFERLASRVSCSLV